MHAQKGLAIALSAGIAFSLIIGVSGCAVADLAKLTIEAASDYVPTTETETAGDDGDLLTGDATPLSADDGQALPGEDENAPVSGSDDISDEPVYVDDTPAPAVQTVSVPNLVGMYQSDAFNTLAAYGLYYNDIYVPSNEYTNGYVVRTDPVAGIAVEPGSTVVVFISMSDDWIVSFANQAPGMSEADVISALEGAGYVPMHLDLYDGYSDYIAQGRVLMVEPAGQAMIVYYGLSLGPQTPAYTEPEPAYEEPTYTEPEPSYEEPSYEEPASSYEETATDWSSDSWDSGDSWDTGDTWAESSEDDYAGE